MRMRWVSPRAPKPTKPPAAVLVASPEELAKARALHARSVLDWIPWEQLDRECQAEYLAEARKGRNG